MKQILSGYYDSDEDGSAIAQWIANTRGVPGIVGAMYTIWEDEYDAMDVWARRAWGSGEKLTSEEPSVPVWQCIRDKHNEEGRRTMNASIRGGGIALMALCAAVAGSLVLQRQVGVGAQSGAAAAPSNPVTVSIGGTMPPGAVALYSGKAGDLTANWYRRGSQSAPNWTVSGDGIATPRGSDITSKQEFGDCYLHVEFRTPADASGNPISGGNSGVGLQGRYEVQILSSYGREPRRSGCGSLYSQKPPRVNASKKAGEWQSFDIVFRAPRLDASGKVTEQPRLTLFHNGVLVQNNESFNGPTGIQYDELKDQPATGPLVLQGDHDPVQFRNIWIVPL